MKIILKKDVHGLGFKDDILTVKDGYGRNYLLPQRMAVLATEKAIKAVNEELKQRAHKIAKMKADAEAKAKQFEGLTLQIEAKVSDGTSIYGSVGAPQIVEALQAKGCEIENKNVLLKAVKALGQYTAVLQFHKEVSIELPFEVIPDEQSKAAAQAAADERKAQKEKDAAREAAAQAAEAGEAEEAEPAEEA